MERSFREMPDPWQAVARAEKMRNRYIHEAVSRWWNGRGGRQRNRS